MTRKPDVIVIGAGLFGAFTAWHLARAGLSATIVDRGWLGAQSSGANFGNLRLQGRMPAQYALSLLAQEFWEDFEAQIGEGCEYDRTGHIYFASSEDGRKTLLKYLAASNENGLVVEALGPEDLARLVPGISPAIKTGSYSDRCATANPRLATPAVCRSFLRAGGTLEQGWHVSDVRREGDGFVVTSQDGRTMSSAVVVNAAGNWAGAFAESFGEAVPMFGAGPPQFVTEPLPYILRPVLQAVEGDVIVRQIPRGNFIFAGYPRTRSNADGEHTFVPPQKIRAGMAALCRAMPGIAGADIIRSWSGVEGYLPDMLPVIDRSRTTQGLFHAFGGSGGGFQIAPAVGIALSALITGSEPLCDLTPYRIDRFGSDLVASEKIGKEFDRD
ncbi:MAG: FAD-binding oxidoreductase [Rhizobiaceae bacterium]|nr:FAD-binding oxidoreductase [Rhizobiaceae bacterium]